MSEPTNILKNLFSETRPIGRTLFNFFWGDRRGLIVFLGAIVFFGLSWRVGFFISDNIPIANTLANIANGRLAIVESVYGRSPEDYLYPGMYVVEGAAYGRNYGQVFFALPFLWLIWVASELIGLQTAVVGIWTGSFFGFVWLTGIEFRKRRTGILIAVTSSVALFSIILVTGQPIESKMRYLVALQISTMVAAAFVGVLLYRIISRLYDRDLGLIAGSMTVLSTSVGFWATIPKRHALIAALAVAVLYCFVRSRQEHRNAFAFRVLAYGLTGLAIWVHPPDGAVLLIALAGVDFVTKSQPLASQQAIILGMVIASSLIPFFLTNFFISGNPLLPPRFLSLGGEMGPGVVGGLDKPGQYRTNGGSVGLFTSSALVLFEAWLMAMTATAIGSVLFSRIISRLYDRDRDTLVGTFVVLSIIIGYWARIQERHLVIAALAVAVIYCILRSRREERYASAFRGLAYGLTGLAIWVHYPAGVAMILTLAGFDFLTRERQTSVRDAVLIGVMFTVSLIPFFITNYFFSGNPFVSSELISVGETTESGVVQCLFGPGKSTSTGFIPTFLIALFESITSVSNRVISRLIEGLLVFVDQPNRPYHTFIRSGVTEYGDYRDTFSILEAMPIFGVLAALVLLFGKRIRSASICIHREFGPKKHYDLLIAVYIILVAIVYQPRLPIHAQINMRYLVPILPGLVYSIFRLSVVRSTIKSGLGEVMWYYALSVSGIGLVFLLISIVTRPKALELMEMYSTTGLVLAGLLAVWSVAIHNSKKKSKLWQTTGRSLLSITSAFATVLILLPRSQFMSTGIQVIPFF